MDKAEFQKTTANAGIIGLSAFGGATIGFVLQLLVAYYFGAGNTTDAYFMAQSSSELLSKLLLGGSIVSVFIPIFIDDLQKRGQAKAWREALNVFHVTTGLFLVLIVLVAIFTKPFVHLIAPGFDAATTDLTIHLLRVLLPSFLFLFVVDLGTAMLQAIKHFTVPASLRIVAPTISVLTIITLVHQVGIYALAIGVVLGSVVQMALIIGTLRHKGFHYKFVFHPLDASIKTLVYLLYPFIISMLTTQVAGIVYRMLVSHLPAGSLASLKFAEKITQLTSVIFLTSLATALFPVMAEKASRHDYQGLKNTIASAIRVIWFVSLPIVVGIVLLREPLIHILFQRGSFTVADSGRTSIALLYLALGLTTNGMSAIFGYATLALKKTKAAVAVTVASQIVAIALFILLVPAMGHAGLALASSLVPVAIAAMYMAYLSKFIPNIITIFWHRTYLKTIILTGVAAAIVIGWNAAFVNSVDNQTFVALHVILATITAGGVYFGLAYLWRVPEIRYVTEAVQGRLNKWKKPV